MPPEDNLKIKGGFGVKLTEIDLTVGVFAGILNEEGKELIQRRVTKYSAVPGKSFYGDYELPGGGLTETELRQFFKAAALRRLLPDMHLWLSERLKTDKLYTPLTKEPLQVALKREVKEEEGLTIIPGYASDVTKLYRTVLVQTKINKIDIAIVVPVLPSQWSGEPTGEIVEWVTPRRIKELCLKPKGEQIVSGWGKRMCQMMLWVFTATNAFGEPLSKPEYKEEAQKYLDEILEEKGYYPGALETVNII